jgi:hypothetical protein
MHSETNRNLEGNQAMASIFSKGVIRKSEQLRKANGILSDIVVGIESKNDLAGFVKSHPEQISLMLQDLKEARKLIYRVVERLNFPEKFFKNNP